MHDTLAFIVATKCCLIYSVNRLRSVPAHELCSKTELQNVSADAPFVSQKKKRAGKGPHQQEWIFGKVLPCCGGPFRQLRESSQVKQSCSIVF